MNFVFTILGKNEFIAKNADRIARLGPALFIAMRDEMVRVADYVRGRKLQGQVLQHRTGTLSRSITGQATEPGTGLVVGQVGTSGVPYAGVHEFGGTVSIPSHERVITQAFGRPITPTTVVVNAYQAHFPVRSYLRTSADENSAQVALRLQEAVKSALQ